MAFERPSPSQSRSKEQLIRSWTRSSPVRWARFSAPGVFPPKRLLGLAGVSLARMRPLLAPPVLVISYPRSGSSWVGETLGSAADAVYLREPVTQANLARGNPTLDRLESPGSQEVYRYFGGLAFEGIPAFPERIVPAPAQWQISRRSHRRVVVKEVNPFATHWFVEQYRPRVIFLVRHPAAVALSHKKLGWWSPDADPWRSFGSFFGLTLRQAMDTLQAYDDYRIVNYEALCAEPERGFRELFEFAGLTWNEAVAKLVQQHSAEGDSNNPYGTSRNSQQMIDAWRGKIEASDLANLRDSYLRHRLPWYNTPEDW